jgi:hypothetical protein
MSEPRTYAQLVKNSREQLRISSEVYQGVPLVQVRVVMKLSESSGIWSPTKKGLAFQPHMLPDIIAALRAAEAHAREQGLIGGDA